MICSSRELGVGDDHAGILVLSADASPGDDAVALLGLRDEVLDIAVTPDRGYCLSIRGIAREAATAFGVDFHDPADVEALPIDGAGHPGQIADPTAADRLVLRTVTGLDPGAQTPAWLQRRLLLCRHASGVARRRRHQLRDARDSGSRCTPSTAHGSPVRSSSAAPHLGSGWRPSTTSSATWTARTC